jgi:quercetin dioxygenase-like cupin family protein
MQTLLPVSEAEYRSEINIATVLKTERTSSGQPIFYPLTTAAEISMMRVSIPPGAETGRHLHPVPGIIYILAGTLTVETQGQTKEFYAGQGFAECINAIHNGINHGKSSVELLILFLGVRDQLSTIPMCSTCISCSEGAHGE